MSKLVESVRAALKSVPSWASIDELFARVSESTPLSVMRADHVQHVKEVIRRELKSLRLPDGGSLFESVVTMGPDGKTLRRYKQIPLFDVSDFRQSIAYHAERNTYHGRRANWLALRCKKQCGVQLPLPFPGLGVEGDEARSAS